MTVEKIAGGGTFEEEGHVYRNADGVWLPSVTQAIGEAGLGVDFNGVPRAVIEAAGRRGTKIHTALRYALEGDLAWRTLDASLRPVVRAGIAALKEAGFELVRAEERALSSHYHFGGTSDLEGLLRGVDAIVDAKSGSCVPIGAIGLQTSGYALLRAERLGGRDRHRSKRYCLRLFPDRGEARLIPVPTDPYEDEADFLAAVRIWHRLRRNDLKKELR